jgi:hypothetical protein
MQEQNYKNHRQFVPMYHFVLLAVLILTLMGSVINLYRSSAHDAGFYSASLIVVLVFISAVLFFYCREFPLIAQDRAIRAEENLRHFALTGKLLDPRLTMKQIVALRFSSDEEFPALATRAAEENLGHDAIKLAIKHWRADTYRV